MRLSTADLDGNGRTDVVVACRSGLYVFFNKGYSPRTRPRNPLPDRNSYPGNVQWEAPRPSPRAAAGRTATEATLDLWTEWRKDGAPNHFERPLREFAGGGYVGLQDHGSPLWHRNNRIKALSVSR